MKKIRKGDEVIVITGRDRGRRGTVLEVLKDQRILVEGINIAKKHQKGNPQRAIEGGIVDKAMPLDISNVQVFNPKSKKGDRVGIRVTDDGQKERYFKSTGDTVDI